MAWSDPKTWTADVMLTASDLNQYVSDNLSALYALVQGGGRKNLLQNGAMQVHQRGTSTAGITGISYYTADRWITSLTTLGTWTQSVENDAPTGSGFRKSLKMLCTTNDASPAAGDLLLLAQYMEGQNLQSIRKGTANAEPLTLSFWTKSNKTGTYVAELSDIDNTRHVAATYTVAASGTWEQQTITFPADLTGALDNDNAASFALRFWLGAGSTYTSGTLAETWATATTANAAPGQTNLAAATNNYWQVTGVQLETGSASTGFEFKDFGTELRECQRYYETSYSYGTAAGTATALGEIFTTATSNSGSDYVGNIRFAVPKRSVTYATAFYNGTTGAGGTWEYAHSGASGTGSPAADLQATGGFRMYMPVGAAYVPVYVYGHWVASADL